MFAYQFGDYLVSEKDRTLSKKGEIINLAPKEFEILLELVANAGMTLSKKQLLERIWGSNTTFVEESNVSVHIRRIRGKIAPDNFIQTDRRLKGYKFDLATTKTPEIQSSMVFESHQFETEIAARFGGSNAPEPVESRTFAVSVVATLGSISFLIAAATVIETPVLSKQFLTVFFASTAYGILICVGLLLETAYSFSRYGWRVVRVMPGVLVMNLTATLTWLGGGHDLAAWTVFLPILTMVVAGVITCALAYFLLPQKPITQASFQTQSSFSAFCKNTIVYFLPIYTFFVFLPISAAYSTNPQLGNPLVALAVLGLLLLIFLISWLSTNYLSDHLICTDDSIYGGHSLFSALLQVRTILCFGPSFLSTASWLATSLLRE